MVGASLSAPASTTSADDRAISGRAFGHCIQAVLRFCRAAAVLTLAVSVAGCAEEHAPDSQLVPVTAGTVPPGPGVPPPFAVSDPLNDQKGGSDGSLYTFPTLEWQDNSHRKIFGGLRINVAMIELLYEFNLGNMSYADKDIVSHSFKFGFDV